MPIVTRHSLITVAVLSGVVLAAAGSLVWSGVYNIGADEAHMPMTSSLLETVRERSITARANRLHPPPDLTDAARIRQGAGNYNAMCMGCHLAPGMEGTELSRGLYPSPPNLSQADVEDPAHHFWVIKHGVKASGMPAWGKSMGDEYIWNMVAFVQQLPKLSPEQYEAMVASSGGHDHGGGETKPHGHPEGTPADHHGGEAAAGDHADMPGMDMGGDMADHHAADAAPAGEGVMHTHADGTRERHPAPPSLNTTATHAVAPAPAKTNATQPASEPAEHLDDGHHH